jgi:hypothetical protein
VQAAGAHGFVLEVGDHRLVDGLFGNGLHAPVDVGIDLALRARLPDVRALQRVDVDLANAEIDDLAHRRLVAHMEGI